MQRGADENAVGGRPEQQGAPSRRYDPRSKGRRTPSAVGRRVSRHPSHQQRPRRVRVLHSAGRHDAPRRCRRDRRDRRYGRAAETRRIDPTLHRGCEIHPPLPAEGRFGHRLVRTVAFPHRPHRQFGRGYGNVAGGLQTLRSDGALRRDSLRSGTGPRLSRLRRRPVDPRDGRPDGRRLGDVRQVGRGEERDDGRPVPRRRRADHTPERQG